MKTISTFSLHQKLMNVGWKILQQRPVISWVANSKSKLKYDCYVTFLVCCEYNNNNNFFMLTKQFLLNPNILKFCFGKIKNFIIFCCNFQVFVWCSLLLHIRKLDRLDNLLPTTCQIEVVLLLIFMSNLDCIGGARDFREIYLRFCVGSDYHFSFDS